MNAKRYSKNAYVFAAIVFVTAILLFVNFILQCWRYQGAQWRSAEEAILSALAYQIQAIFISLIIACGIVWLNRTGREWITVPVYVAFLCLALYYAVSNTWRSILFTPFMLYTVIFPSSYFASRTYNRIWHKWVLILLSFLMPAVITTAGFNRKGVGFTLCVTGVLVLIKVLIFDDIQMHDPTIVIASSILIIVLFIVCSGSDIVNTLATRIEVFILGGNYDVQGAGYMYYHLAKGLKNAPVIGSSPYLIPLDATISIPSSTYFSYKDVAYSIAVIVMKGGWFFGIIILGLMVFQVKLLFSLASATVNNYARYVLYSVAVLFAFKTGFGIMSCFSVFVSDAALPMTEPYGAITDLTLLISAVALSATKETSNKLLHTEIITVSNQEGGGQ